VQTLGRIHVTHFANRSVQHGLFESDGDVDLISRRHASIEARLHIVYNGRVLSVVRRLLEAHTAGIAHFRECRRAVGF
jgi:hypothetical protein